MTKVPEKESPNDPAGSGIASSGERANILLVDDRSDKLLALEAVLAGLGQNLVLVRSGKEALRLLLQHEFALIVPGCQHAGHGRLRNRSTDSPETPLRTRSDHLC